MSETEMSGAVLTVRHERVRAHTRTVFYVAMSGVLLLSVLVGFAPTLYLRLLFKVPPIPVYLYVHGAVLTAWFVTLFVQTTLVAAGRTHVHRQLGIAGSILAVAVVAMSLVTVLRVPAHWQSLGIDVLSDPYVAGLVWLDLAAVVDFSTFVALAIYLRCRADVHKRLMLLASLCIVGPAIGRIGQFTVFGGFGRAVNLASLIALPMALIAYEWLSRRRMHFVTVVGVVVYFVSLFAPIAIGASAFARSLIIVLARRG